MTNAELIQKIRNEIERLKKNENELIENSTKKYGAYPASSDIMLIAYQNVLSILDTLESEKPINQDEELNNEIKAFVNEYNYEKSEDILLIAIVARHFAEWGYLRAAEKYNEIEYNRQRAEESVPNDLEEAAWDCVLDSVDVNNPVLLPKYKELLTYLFIAGAKWAMEQFEKNRLAACDNMSKEEYDRETDFVDSIIKKEHRQPTFSDAINYGMRLQREQMLKEAVEGIVTTRSMAGNIVTAHVDYRYKDGQKVRIIIVKEAKK